MSNGNLKTEKTITLNKKINIDLPSSKKISNLLNNSMLNKLDL
jgi:hypothetical protein